MNALHSAISCALLCALPVSPSSAPPAETTVVIRYDPEAIFLTHDLVSPLCAREVELTDASGSGALVLERMDSNLLQPKGVFVGRARVEWSAELPAERREALFEDGLAQLRSALARRLVQSRRDQLQQRIAVLERMEVELREALERQAREQDREDQLRLVSQQLEAARASIRTRELELRAAKQDLMFASAKVQEIEAKIDFSSTTVAQVREDLARTREMVNKGVVSELELRVSEQRLHAAENDLEVERAQLESHRMQVSRRGDQLVDSEQGLSQLVQLVADLEERAAVLTDAARSSRSSAERRLALESERGRLTELGVELQRARAAQATITDVTIERW